MSDDLVAVEDYVAGLLAQLEGRERMKLARTVATDLRRQNAGRIASQKNPDGSAFAPRKSAPSVERLAARRNRIKNRVAQRATGPMFRKLRQAQYLKTEATSDHAATGFPAGAITRIARVHQEGLADRAVRSPKARLVRYPQRVLLGFTDSDRAQLLERVLAHIDQ